MDSDSKTCGTCRHGNLYDCDKCEKEYEGLRAENYELWLDCDRSNFVQRIITAKCGLDNLRKPT